MKRKILIIMVTIVLLVVILIMVSGSKKEHISGYTIIDMKSDYEIEKNLRDYYDNPIENGIYYGNIQFENGYYKDAYNAYKVVIDRMRDELTNDEFQEYYYLYASMYARMAVCNYKYFQFEDAKIIIDEAISMCEEFDREFEEFYILVCKGLIYMEYDVFMGYKDSDEVIEILMDVAEFETMNDDEYYLKQKKNALQSLAEMYTFSPLVADTEKAVQSYERILNDYSQSANIYYRLINAYIDNNQLDKAKENYDILKEKGLSDSEKNAIEARIGLKELDLKTAKKYIDNMGGFFSSKQEKAAKNQLLAMYYIESNDYGSAVKELEELLEKMPLEVYNKQVLDLCDELDMDVSGYIKAIEEDRATKPDINLEVRME